MGLFAKCGIEVPMLAICFCWLLSDYVLTNFLIYRTCYITLGYNQTICTLLGTNNGNDEIKKIESDAQPIVSNILMAKTIIEISISVVCSLILGPWSNKHGRKPVLISTLIGYFVGYLCMVTICFLEWVSPWYFLISCFITVIWGGVCSLFTVSYCYITDITVDKNRGIRMGILQGCFSLGSVAGTLLSSYVFNAVGYTGIFGICAVVSFISILYTWFMVPESLLQVERENKLKDLLDVSVIAKTFKTVGKRRHNRDRTILGLLITVLTLTTFATFSESIIFFLFVRNKFQWSLKDYTLFLAICNLSDIFVSIIILIGIHKMLKVEEISIILFGFITFCVSSIVTGVANTNWMIYLGASIKRFSCATGPLGKSAISKIVPHDDIGPVFALTTSLESIIQIISIPIYTALYNNTMTTNASAFNFLSASVFGFNIFITCVVIILNRINYHNPETQSRLIKHKL